VSGLAVTAVAMGFNLLPIVDVASRWAFAGKVAGVSLALNVVGMAIYWNGARHRTERE
jgi:ABC-type sulfate transport system permease component